MPFAIAIVPPPAISQRIKAFTGPLTVNRPPLAAVPHITVKAQGGLTDGMDWLPGVQQCVSGFRTFEMTLRGSARFGDDVVFIRPKPAPLLHQLHHALIDIVRPDDALMAQYFEGGAYTPHLTLFLRGQGFSVSEMSALERAAAQTFAASMTFTVSSLVLFRQLDGIEAYTPWREMAFG